MSSPMWSTKASPRWLLAFCVLLGAAAYVAHPEFSRIAVLVCLVVGMGLSWLLKSWDGQPPSRRSFALGLVGCGAVQLLPASYWTSLGPTPTFLVAFTMATAIFACALLVWVEKPALDRVAVWLGAAALTGLGSFIILAVEEPPNDTWVIFNQAASSVLRANIYGMTWIDSPGLQKGFVYLPMSALLLAPFEWILGDVRWGLLLCILAAGLLLFWRGHRAGNPCASMFPLLFWFAPGVLVITEWTWNEPLLLVLFLSAMMAFERRRPALGIVFLILAMATKQHLLILAPLLAAWEPVGFKRMAVVAAGWVGVCLPWIVAGPAQFWHDTVTEHLDAPVRPESVSLFTWIHLEGLTLPFWFPAVVVLTAVVVATDAVRQGQPSWPRFFLWLALVLLVANVMNKQTFINQWWLVAALMLCAAAGTPTGRLTSKDA